MTRGFCKLDRCPAAKTGLCYDNLPDLEHCPNWQLGAAESASSIEGASSIDTTQQITKGNTISDSQNVIWTGYPLKLTEIELISRRTNPLIVAPVGESFAGKSSFLGMLHTLLLRGHRLKEYTFAGSATLLGWEALAASLRYNKGQSSEPTPTPSDPEYYSFLHWALRRTKGTILDILFPDASGEVFSQWAVDRDEPNSENVRWIHDNADAFIFFVSCQSLIIKRGESVTNLVDLANRVKENLRGRPLLVVWSKADLIGEVRAAVKERLIQQLDYIFGTVPHIEISKVLQEQPDHKQLNNLAVLDQLFSQLEAYHPKVPTLEKPVSSQDPFLLYRNYESDR
ncbi:hypothetical protein GO755_04445 [Spirosoma sp. HMF4905]|uniref:Double-GTPase 2 domain-containing protein n=1 Tax=Spirosoma arboris TaxID=2682092 RepID=A0A7K1S625_9BACT|nr:hypothetical protein [Spirosoma arboris]MVM29271.1 hypothetical protein [Spirosoma arboris]